MIERAASLGRGLTLAILVLATGSGGCTRSVIVHPEDVPPLLTRRSDEGGPDIQVPTTDGRVRDVPRDFDTLHVLPPEERTFMSPPGRPDLAVVVTRRSRRARLRDGWTSTPTHFTVPIRAEVDGGRLYVTDAETRRRRAGEEERPLAYRTEDVRGVAVVIPDPIDTTATILGVTAGVAVVATIFAGVVVVSSDGWL